MKYFNYWKKKVPLIWKIFWITCEIFCWYPHRLYLHCKIYLYSCSHIFYQFVFNSPLHFTVCMVHSIVLDKWIITIITCILYYSITKNKLACKFAWNSLYSTYSFISLFSKSLTTINCFIISSVDFSTKSWS